MKKSFVTGAIALSFANIAVAQDIPQSRVPSIIVNSFQQRFPKAYDVEWEIKGGLYKVDFETSLFGADHDAWFDKTGKLIKHEEEISKSDLPKKVRTGIEAGFSGYRIDDPKKINEGNRSTYVLELKSVREEWKVAFDAEGNVLSKVAD